MSILKEARPRKGEESERTTQVFGKQSKVDVFMEMETPVTIEFVFNVKVRSVPAKIKADFGDSKTFYQKWMSKNFAETHLKYLASKIKLPQFRYSLLVFMNEFDESKQNYDEKLSKKFKIGLDLDAISRELEPLSQKKLEDRAKEFVPYLEKALFVENPYLKFVKP